MEIGFLSEVYDLTLAGHRKILHDVVNETFNEEVYEPTDEEYDELDEVHTFISNQDIKGLLNGYFARGELNFIEVEEDEHLLAALESNGYKVEKSLASRSLYAINDSGEEVRISDHKRPAVVEDGIYVRDHEYENELVIDGNVVNKDQLKKFGFSKLNKDEYYLS